MQTKRFSLPLTDFRQQTKRHSRRIVSTTTSAPLLFW
jgi:hypothetical protein